MWRGPRPRWKRTSHCRLHAAKYAATSGSGKGKSFRIDCKCANSSKGRNQSAADVDPNVSIIFRTENSAISPGENVTQGIDCQSIHVDCAKPVILFRPTIAVVSRPEYSTAFTHEGTRSCKDLSVATDCQSSNIS